MATAITIIFAKFYIADTTAIAIFVASVNLACGIYATASATATAITARLATSVYLTYWVYATAITTFFAKFYIADATTITTFFAHFNF